MRPSLAYDAVNNALWIKIPSKSAAVAEARARGLTHPRDRNGKVDTKYYSSEVGAWACVRVGVGWGGG